MKLPNKHKNWLREEVTPISLRRTGSRVKRNPRDWNRDFSFQSLSRDKAWTFWRNTHKSYPFGETMDDWRGKGMKTPAEVRSKP